MLPTSAEVLAASQRLRGVAVRTPLVRSATLTSRLGAEVFLKCEQQQRTGSFKLRGAYNALAVLPMEARGRGVVAASAGNHGLGVAYAARSLAIHAKIFVPATAPEVKRLGIVALGAELDLTSPDYDAAHQAAELYAREHGMWFVDACKGAPLLAGQGTVAVEILDVLPHVRTLIVPVGGGGLVGGISAFVRSAARGVHVIGVQSDRTNAMAASLAAGRRVPVAVTATLADGLAGQIDDEGYEIGRVAIDEMETVSEAQIADAISALARDHGTRVEGSGAVGVAALLSGRTGTITGPVAVVLSGGNIDDDRWKGLVNRESSDVVT
ncbi:MAG TPA: threonine/serine dehydratase [Gemmatimonadaceae bacterium]